MGQVRSKTRSEGQILEKPCVSSRGHILSQIIMKLDQNVCFDEIWKSLKIVCIGSKTRSLGQILKNLVYTLKAIFSVRLS